MDQNLLALIITAILTLLAAFGGVRIWVGKLIKAVKESTDVGVALDVAIKTVDDAIKDNLMEVTEIKLIEAKFKQVRSEMEAAREAWQDLFNKHVK